jgi:hypothetical protein
LDEKQTVLKSEALPVFSKEQVVSDAGFVGTLLV